MPNECPLWVKSRHLNLQLPDSKSFALSVELRICPTRVTRSMARRPGASGRPSETHKTDRSGT